MQYYYCFYFLTSVFVHSIIDLCCHQLILWVYNKDGAEVKSLNTQRSLFSNNFHRDLSLIDFAVQRKKENMAGEDLFHESLNRIMYTRFVFYSHRKPNQPQQRSKHRLLLLLQVTHANICTKRSMTVFFNC